MSMLAEQRSRQKWSDDPRNTRWANDKSKFGYTMLEKMGWSEGKGLGQSLNGSVSHVKIKKRTNNAGVGAKRASDDDWISHQDDFNSLLNQLNQGKVTGTDAKPLSSLEARVRSSRKKILYTKFVKSKDLSNASSNDLACIFGTRSTPATPQLSDNDSDAASTASCPAVTVDTNQTTEHGIEIINTGVNISDYFAKKMAALKNRSLAATVLSVEKEEDKDKYKIGDKDENEDTEDKDSAEEVSSAIGEETTSEDVSKKSKKNKRKLERDDDKNSNSDECEEKRKRMKRKKKNREKPDDVVRASSENVTSEENVTSSDSNSVADEDLSTVVEIIDVDNDENSGKSKLKKSKKSKNNKTENIVENKTVIDLSDDDNEVVEVTSSVVSSRKSDVVEIVDKIPKQKKKKKKSSDNVIKITSENEEVETVLAGETKTGKKKKKSKQQNEIQCDAKLTKEKKRAKSPASEAEENIVPEKETQTRKKSKKNKSKTE